MHFYMCQKKYYRLQACFTGEVLFSTALCFTPDIVGSGKTSWSSFTPIVFTRYVVGIWHWVLGDPLFIKIKFIHRVSFVRPFLFSVHISYGKGKYIQIKLVFFQNLLCSKFIPEQKGVTHRIHLTQIYFHAKCIYIGFWIFFWLTPKTTEWPKMTLKMKKMQNSPMSNVLCNFCYIFDRLCGSECCKRSTRQEFVVQ